MSATLVQFSAGTPTLDPSPQGGGNKRAITLKVMAAYESAFENGLIVTPFASSFARTVRAIATALGSSP